MPHIVAIGNALVDSEYLLNEDQLRATGLTKGNMTLASHSEQQALIDQLAQQQIQASKQASGGSAANSIYAAASLGSQTYYACRVGDDAAGQFYLADLNRVGIATASQSIALGGTTGSCMVIVTPDGERTMQTHLGTSAEINADDIDFSQLSNAKWLYLEGYLAMSPSIQEGISQLRDYAREHDIKVAVSFADPAVVKFGHEGLVHMLADGVDVIFCNAEEAMLFTGKSSHEAATKALLDHSKMAVVTRGAHGTLVAYQEGVVKEYYENNLVEVSSPVITDVLDTNGAGDNFAGAFLYALSENHEIRICGKLASAVASQVIRQFGPRLLQAQYQDILAAVLKTA